MRRLTLALLLACLPAAKGRAGQGGIGDPAPPLNLRHWVNSTPLEMSSLRGKVVLIRWWTDGCSLCENTAPALHHLQQKYAAQGLEIIGVFHPKPAGDWNVDRVRRAAERLGFTFPVALDADWTALRRWWLNGHPRDWTSVSFLVDKHGVIRLVHPGGEFHEGQDGASHEACRRDYRQIEETIQRLLAERNP